MTASTSNKVWIIDDDRSIRWVLEKALMQEGLNATVFEDGNAALARLGKEQPDAIISDIRMPGIDGLSLLTKIRLDFPDLPVIIKADSSIQYQRVVDVLDLAGRLEITQLGLVTQKIVK